MRIATWNCQMGLDKKRDALLSLAADVAVVPECAEKSIIALRQCGLMTLWFGSNPNKGLGIICRQGWSIRALPQPQQKWIAAITVDSPTPFTLIAVWACAVKESRPDSYIGQVYQALVAHPEWFEGNPVVVAGDLNSNQIWDAERKIGNHSAVVRFLEERGLVSAYHEKFNELHGAETCPTYFQYRHEHRPYHIDYVFIPREWMLRLRDVKVYTYKEWSKTSDHCPIVVDIC